TLDSTSFTVGGWFYVTQPGTYLASKLDGNGHGWYLLNDLSNRPTFGVGNSASVTTRIQGSVPLTPNTWYYIAANCDGTHLNLYVNGQLAASGTMAQVRFTPTRYYVPSTTPMVIGGASFSDPTVPNMSGMVDQFAFYNSVLTANQILATY